MGNNMLPWLNYATISFLESCKLSKKKVFEYGSGRSTIWFANQGAQVTSVESRKEWYDSVVVATANFSCRVIYCDKPHTFADTILGYDAKYDIILIDSLQRAKCLSYAVDKIAHNGIIILDNSERVNLSLATIDILSQGFRMIRLKDHGPGREDRSTCYIFLRHCS